MRMENVRLNSRRRGREHETSSCHGSNEKAPYFNAKGTSCILSFSPKGDSFLRSLNNTVLQEVSYKEVISENPMIYESRQKNNLYDKFDLNFKRKGLFYAVKCSKTFFQRLKSIIPYRLKKALKKYFISSTK